MRRSRPVALLLAALLVVPLAACSTDDDATPNPRPDTAPSPRADQGAGTEAPVPPPADPTPAQLPGGGQRVFAQNRILVAYYGTGGTSSLGVLGEDPPARMHRRLVNASRPFAGTGDAARPVVPVYELIVTVADAGPGRDGDYSHDIDRAVVQRYISAARRNGALVLLDLQPGRTDFLTVAKRWQWALRSPHVGLALDPEWRMGPREVPGRVIGSVDADEVNAVSAWLAGVVERQALPEKVLMVHQFRTDMLTRPQRVKQRRGLALVQHVDGFGTPGQKLDTYGAVARPQTFSMGFKLFYDEDRPRMTPAEVLRVRPPVRFVSFQ